MLDLLGNLPALLGGLVALVAAFWGYGAYRENKGDTRASQRLSEQDKENAKSLRKRVAEAKEANDATWDDGMSVADLERLRRDLRERQDD